MRTRLVYPTAMRMLFSAGAIVAVFVGIFLAVPAAQTPPLPSFEVASVKQNVAPDARPGFTPRADRFARTAATTRDLIAGAYRRRGFENVLVVGGPAWLDSDRFDVNAKIEDGAGTLEELYLPDGKGSPGRVYLMVRSLLAERFKLKVHRETREMPIFALMLARSDGRLGPKLTHSEIDCDKANAEIADAIKRTGRPPERAPGQPPPCSVGGPPGTLNGNDITMQMFADVLTNSVSRAVATPVSRTVVDRTGLPGYFKLTLEWTPDELAAGTTGVSIFTALQEQLGLKLEPTRGPVEVLVVDHVERPTPD